MSFPRISRNWLGFMPIRFLPLKIASPLVIVCFLALSPMIVRQVTLLPLPDSPTMPSVFPFSMLKLTPSTALTIPSSVSKYVFRSLTSSSAIDVSSSPRFRGALRQPDPRVYPGVQDVDDEVEDDDGQCSEHHHAHYDRQIVGTDRPDRGLPEAGEAVDRLREDRAAEPEADVHSEH